MVRTYPRFVAMRAWPVFLPVEDRGKTWHLVPYYVAVRSNLSPFG